MKESYLVRKILDYLKTLPETFAWKEHGGQYSAAGIPDIICCHKGRFYAFEVKTEKGRLTPLQAATIARINGAGGTALKITSLAEVKALLGEDE